LRDVPVTPNVEGAEAAMLKFTIDSADDTNKRIIKNNTYKEVLDKLPDLPIVSEPVNNTAKINAEILHINHEIKVGDGFAKQCSSPNSKCPTCNSILDKSTEYASTVAYNTKKPILESKLAELNAELLTYKRDYKIYADYISNKAEIEKYHALYDPSLDSTLIEKSYLQAQLAELNATIAKINREITEATAVNKQAQEHNSKVAVISGQIIDAKADLGEVQASLSSRSSELAKLTTLVKAFSPTGLLAYKIESMVKDLESVTNEYLSVLSSGRFQLSFQVNSSDKLNVIITDNGNDIDINALSTGERARVNVATLLAIRKLMQALSNSRTNLLILDETVENLDAEGKEKLIEVLLQEENLNTFLISHGFSHPLLEKIHIVKENNISRIE
jgi:DNA repair exonuclease SbcCD ATPase subunit